MSENETERFPLFKMIIGDKEHWLPAQEAGIAYDSGWVPVQIGGLVLDNDLKTREITDAERGRIVDIADEYFGNK